MLDKGKDLDWFGSTEIRILALTALVGFVIFIVWELTETHPVVDLKLFARRNFWTSSLAMSLAYGAFFGNVVLLPLWLQQYMGYTATEAGIVLAPVGLLAIVLTPIVGRTVHRIDPRIFATGAFIVFALVLYMRSQFNTSADFWTLMIPTIIQGAAMALFFIPLVTLSLSGLAPSRIPSASGLFNFARITAGSFGTSIATTFWDHRATLHHAQLVERVGGNPAAAQALSTMQASGLTTEQSYAMLNRMVDQQAFMLSANDVFFASALLFLVLIVVVWLARPVKGSAGGSEAAAGAH
jgi:DHA2 family multidrug resistance protein